MLSRPDAHSLSSQIFITRPINLHFPQQMGFPNHNPYHSLTNPAHDPAAVDFRAFYPYTPNEVKHRKRTTSAQLKILEDIFKRDTKPNAQLRNDLASKLDMTARGVQVWFQNRRAKEKNRATKLSISKSLRGSGKPFSSGPSADDDLVGSDDEGARDDPPDAAGQASAHDASEQADISSQGSSPLIPSPPQLHVITDTSHPSWLDSPVEAPPDSAGGYFSRPNPIPGANDLYSLRRGSLPVNAFPPPLDEDSDGPPSIDSLDPLARRRSVDASLQRLANNPYAHLARAKNGALFGPRFGVSSVSRHRSLGRVPYSRPSLPHHASSVPHHLDIRHGSMEARVLRFSPGQHSPSPSPISPYHAVRASLPDHHLYTVTSRQIVSPIPGPLPSPHFSFGDASTPSMTSPSSGDSERNSPDSLRSFTFREDHEEDDRTNFSYDHYPRFGSVASVAASDSSSAYYSEIGGPAVDHEFEADLHAARRESCASGQFLGLMSSLDVTGPSDHPLTNALGLNSYSDFSLPRGSGIRVIEQSEPRHESVASYPSPASTVSPGHNSPQSQDVSSSSSSAPIISHSSELAFALHGQADQALASKGHAPYAQQSADAPAEQNEGSYYFGQQQQQQHQQPEQAQPENNSNVGAPSPNYSAQYGENYHSDSSSNLLSAQNHYAASYTTIADNFGVDGAGDLSLPHHGMEYAGMASGSEVYSYQESINPADLVSPLDSAVHSVESFVPYS